MNISPAGFDRNPHFEAVANAQSQRLAQSMVMSDAAIIRAFAAKSPHDAFALAQHLITLANRRLQAQAHERSVK